MPTVTVMSTIARASVLLQDATNIRWPKAELLDWLNDGQREIVLRKPNASTRNTSVNLVAGSKQVIPNDGVQLLDVVRNVNGSSIRIVDREILDAQLPDWHTMAQAKGVQHYCYSDKDLKTFYVYPPNNGAGQVDLVYSAAPAPAALDGVISIDDIYQSALVDYILYRAYSKDSEYAADPARVASYYTSFVNSLGGKLRMEIAASPNPRDHAAAAVPGSEG